MRRQIGATVLAIAMASFTDGRMQLRLRGNYRRRSY